MACLSLVLFWLACFAGDVVELEPVRSSGISSSANVVCSAITSATTNSQTECNTMPGCSWKVDASVCGPDECWQYDKDAAPTGTNSPAPAYPCACTTTGLYTQQGNVAPACGSWELSGFPPHSNSGSGKDFYCLRQGAAPDTIGFPLDECSFQYLKNGSCTAPFCILVDHTTPEAGKVCKKVPQCAAGKFATPYTNAIRLNSANIADCLTARYDLGETTACNQNPRFYLDANNDCVEDTFYQEADSQENPVCPTGAVVKQVSGVNAGSAVTLSYCANANNPVKNTCWHLTNITNPTNLPADCPSNPNSTGTLLTENTALCTGDCFIQTISSYYYGYTKICVNNDSAAGHSSILVVPSLVALLLLAFFF